MMPGPAQTVHHLRRLLGIDRPIAYVLLARVWSFVSNIGTVFLMLRFLSPVEQGYYFTLISLAALQAIFELGFSFVILQLAAHERAHLVFHSDGSIEGPASAHARLASVLQIAFRWYTRAGILLAIVLLPGGILFFAHNSRPGQQASWLLPWILSVVSCSIAFTLNPVFSFIEGCGEVSQIARLRFHQCLANAACAWGALITHHGLYAPGMIIVSGLIIGCAFLWKRRNLLLGLLRLRVGTYAINWRTEIWPFQWKIAVSWLCSTFTVQLFTPILFHFRNPVEAGQMGMSVSIIGYISTIVLSWIATKASPFGQLVAQHKFNDLNSLFKSSLRQSLSVLLLLDCICMAAVMVTDRWLPRLGQRIVAPPVFALMLLAALATAIVQSQAIYLRSFKREPFLKQSILAASLTLLGSLTLSRLLGALGIALSYFLGMGFVGVIFSSLIYASWKQTEPVMEGMEESC